MTLKTQSTFTLARLQTYEKLDSTVRRFCDTHDVVEIKIITHPGFGYAIVYEEK